MASLTPSVTIHMPYHLLNAATMFMTGNFLPSSLDSNAGNTSYQVQNIWSKSTPTTKIYNIIAAHVTSTKKLPDTSLSSWNSLSPSSINQVKLWKWTHYPDDLTLILDKMTTNRSLSSLAISSTPSQHFPLPTSHPGKTDSSRCNLSAPWKSLCGRCLMDLHGPPQDSGHIRAVSLLWQMTLWEGSWWLPTYHDHITARHPGISKTLFTIEQEYWWLDMKWFVTQFIKGCPKCQKTKSNTTKPKIPTYPIITKPNAQLFETITWDLIVDLPPSNSYDSILTITDHDCTKVAIFLPDNKDIDSEGIAALYAIHVFPHFGIPQRIISDQDPQFTSKFSKELCALLTID